MSFPLPFALQMAVESCQQKLIFWIVVFQVLHWNEILQPPSLLSVTIVLFQVLCWNEILQPPLLSVTIVRVDLSQLAKLGGETERAGAV